MKISIVSPVYNGKKFLIERYDNLKNILSEDIDWIVVNDCSNDGSEDILQELNEKNHVSVINMMENSGPSIARNEGAVRSCKDFIFLLDIDDKIDMDRFNQFMIFCGINNNYDFFFAPLKLTNGDSTLIKGDEEVCKVKYINSPFDYVINGFPQPSSLLIRREFYLKVDIRCRLQWGEDFLLYLLLSKFGNGIRWNKVVSLYLVDGTGRGSQLSIKKRMNLSWCLLKISVKKSKIISSLSYTFYLTLRHSISYLYKKLKRI